MTSNGPLHPPAMKVHKHVKETFRDRLVAALDAYDNNDNEKLKIAIEGLYECRRDWLIERQTNVELIEREARLTTQVAKMKEEASLALYESWSLFLKALKDELKSRGFD